MKNASSGSYIFHLVGVLVPERAQRYCCVCPLRQNRDPLPSLHGCSLAAPPLSLHLPSSLINNSLKLREGPACVGACSIAQLCPTLGGPVDCSPPGSSVHGILQNTGVGCHSLLQGIFMTQGLNLHLLHWQVNLYHYCHLGSPKHTICCA